MQPNKDTLIMIRDNLILIRDAERARAGQPT